MDSLVRGNFTPTDLADRPCREDPYFLPKRRPERSRKKNHKYHEKEFRIDDEYRTKSESYSVYFRPKARRGERSALRRFRRRFLPARVVTGPLAGRAAVALHWAMADAVHLDADETTVVFR